MIKATLTFPHDEMLDWFVDNAFGLVALHFNVIGWGVAPIQLSAYNAPEFLHEKLANKHFRNTKEAAVVCYWIHGGQLHTTLTFHAKVHPSEYPAIAALFGATEPFKSIKADWLLSQSPVQLLEGVRAQ